MKSNKTIGFTLIELLVVMSIVALLIALVGPITVKSIEKASAKQELLSVNNWLKKISYRSFYTGQAYKLVLSGKKAELFVMAEAEPPELIVSNSFKDLFFPPQELFFSTKGFVEPAILKSMHKDQEVVMELAYLHNSYDVSGK